MFKIAWWIILAIVIIFLLRIIISKIAADAHLRKERKGRESARRKEIKEQEERLKAKWEL